MAFDNIHLEMGMYHEAGRASRRCSSSSTPSEGYRGTPLENTDAFQRQLALRHPRSGRGLRHGGEILLHVRIRRGILASAPCQGMDD